MNIDRRPYKPEALLTALKSSTSWTTAWRGTPNEVLGRKRSRCMDALAKGKALFMEDVFLMNKGKKGRKKDQRI